MYQDALGEVAVKMVRATSLCVGFLTYPELFCANGSRFLVCLFDSCDYQCNYNSSATSHAPHPPRLRRQCSLVIKKTKMCLLWLNGKDAGWEQ